MVYEETKGRYRLAIYTDDNPISPRQMDANIGRMVTEFLGDRYKVYDHPPMNGKDYNEDLLYRQEQFRAKRRSSDIER